MKVVGLITEYNPFHNGHRYHVEEAKRITGADYVVAVMSGDFVQRGTPAVIDKYSRAGMALSNGVDLVLELPVCYSTGSAEFFAHGAVALLNKLGIVDYLCFGSECGDIELIKEAAALLVNAPEDYEGQLYSYLKEGLTYPAARLKALQAYLKSNNNMQNSKTLTALFSEPNNILGIEYVKALIHLNSSILPITIQRKSAHYHDTNLSALTDPSSVDTNVVISSATAIRRTLLETMEGVSLVTLKNSVPENVYESLAGNYNKTYPITEEDFSGIIKYKLLTQGSESLNKYVDITSDLADRLKNISDLNISIAELVQTIKTKNMTLTRINRALIHMLLNIRKDVYNEYNSNGYAFYARVLGVRKEASHLLRKITDIGNIPVITKVSKAEEQLNKLGMLMLNEDIFAAHIYNQAVYEKFKTPIANEYKRGILVVNSI